MEVQKGLTSAVSRIFRLDGQVIMEVEGGKTMFTEQFAYTTKHRAAVAYILLADLENYLCNGSPLECSVNELKAIRDGLSSIFDEELVMNCSESEMNLPT